MSCLIVDRNTFTYCQLWHRWCSVISPVASGCFCFVSVHTTQCWCQSRHGQSDLLAEEPAFGLIWGTHCVYKELFMHLAVIWQFGMHVCFFSCAASAPHLSSPWVGNLWWPPVFTLSHILGGKLKKKKSQYDKGIFWVDTWDKAAIHVSWQDKSSSGPLFLDPSMFADLWKRVGASLAKATPDTDFCSANGKQRSKKLTWI